MNVNVFDINEEVVASMAKELDSELIKRRILK